MPRMWNQKVTLAVSWRIATELLRRHNPTIDLHVSREHPGGGQYDSLVLWPGGTEEGLALNMQSCHAHPCGLGDDPSGDQPVDYVDAFLRARDPKTVVDALESGAGLPDMSSRRCPPETPAVVCARVIANILEMHVLSSVELVPSTSVPITFFGRPNTLSRR